MVLAITGAEALYADMGHFGKKPIRMAWFMVAFPALALNYLGQGALLISQSGRGQQSVLQPARQLGVYPLVLLSTMAAVIASQATISGTFSMTKQAIALGLLPRMRVLHTSESEIGQIYIPAVNWLQLVVVLIAVVSFGSSDELAGAYGIAVTATMLCHHHPDLLRHALPLAPAAGAVLRRDRLLHRDGHHAVLVDLAQAVPRRLVPAAAGRDPVHRHDDLEARPRTGVREPAEARDPAATTSSQSLFVAPPTRVYGTAIFLRGESDGVPHALLHNLSHNKVLHERVVFLTVHILEEPWVPAAEQVKVVDAWPQLLPAERALRLQGRTGHPACAEHCAPSRACRSR